jgi:hypothetical protein
MKDILDELGLDPDNLQWHQLAYCDGMPLSWFYDDYETDAETAKATDDACLHCPVMKECGLQGAGGEFGVWGGIYWSGNGKQDKAKNAHKTPEVWDLIRKRMTE